MPKLAFKQSASLPPNQDALLLKLEYLTATMVFQIYAACLSFELHEHDEFLPLMRMLCSRTRRIWQNLQTHAEFHKHQKLGGESSLEAPPFFSCREVAAPPPPPPTAMSFLCLAELAAVSLSTPLEAGRTLNNAFPLLDERGAHVHVVQKVAQNPLPAQSFSDPNCCMHAGDDLCGFSSSVPSNGRFVYPPDLQEKGCVGNYSSDAAAASFSRTSRDLTKEASLQFLGSEAQECDSKTAIPCWLRPPVESLLPIDPVELLGKKNEKSVIIFVAKRVSCWA